MWILLWEKFTLKKHMNIKYEVYNCEECSAQLKTSIKLLKHMTECQEGGKKDTLYFDECGFSCKTKKILKHMNKSGI